MEKIEISGRYRLDSVIGEGGMGAVYRGTNLAIDRPVAVKLVHAIHARNPQIVGRLKQEARATAAIASEHVVQVLDAGEDPGAGLFLVMELLAGEDLERRLEREKRLSPEEAIRIADQAARGLGHAHTRGVIHRDLKPANVFLCERHDENGDVGPSLVKIVDFGIAKLVHDSSSAIRDGQFTLGGCVVGTPQYMSPEQAQGIRIDHRTDVYSLGALLFEMLTGHPPMPELENYEQKILHVVTQPRPRVRDRRAGIDPELDQLVADMLAFDPAHRPQSMREVRERFARLGRVAPLTAISSPPPPPLALLPELPTVNRHRIRNAVWGAAVVTGVVIGIVAARAAGARPPHAQALVASAPASPALAKPVVLEAPQLEVSAVTAKVTVSRVTSPPPLTTQPLPQHPRPQPSPVPIKPSPTPAVVTALDRPFGGTGISQEF